MNFSDWISGAAQVIQDPQQKTIFEQTLNQFAQDPALNNFIDKTFLLQKDYSKLINEHRTAKEQFEKERTEASKLIEGASQVQSQLAAYKTLHQRLNELGVMEMVYPELTAQPLPDPTELIIPQEEEDFMAKLSDEDAALLVNWVRSQQSQVPQTPQQQIVAPPVNPAQPQLEGYVRMEDVQQMLLNTFAASTVGSTKIMESVAEYNQLAGKQESAAEHAMQWQQKGVPFEQYIEETFKLSELRSEAQKKAEEARIEQLVSERLNQRVAAGTFDPTSANPVGSSSIQLFNMLAEAPSFAKPQASPVAPPAQPAAGTLQPQNGDVTPPPAPKNSNSYFEGVDAAANSLRTAKYADQRFDVLRPMGVQ